MMYSKGDTIKFIDGAMALVLDKGLSGPEFFKGYGHKQFLEIFHNLGTWTTSYDTDKYLRDYVWYYVLVGDKKGWYGHHKSWPQRSYHDVLSNF